MPQAAGAGAPAEDPAEALQGLASFRRLGKISFVDLAGSERLKETRRTDGADPGAAVWETGNINRSLFALGKVISALADRSAGREGAAVPFRESKLTQLLIDSLGGSGRTVMVACCSPRRSHSDETMNTLHFAALAMQARCRLVPPVTFPQSSTNPHLTALLTRGPRAERSMSHASTRENQTNNKSMNR